MLCWVEEGDGGAEVRSELCGVRDVTDVMLCVGGVGVVAGPQLLHVAVAGCTVSACCCCCRHSSLPVSGLLLCVCRCIRPHSLTHSHTLSEPPSSLQQPGRAAGGGLDADWRPPAIGQQRRIRNPLR